MLAAPLLPDGVASSDTGLLAGLSKVIGLADAIQLHGILSAAAQGTRASPAEILASTKAELLTARQAMLDTIAAPFLSDDFDGFQRWPNLDSSTGLDGLMAHQRLERFYTRAQQQMQIQIQVLRQRIRKMLSPPAVELAQLVELDLWLEQALVPWTEKALAVIPRQLARYCEQVLSANRDADSSDVDWQQPLKVLTCSLLIAEVDVRLEPVCGLVEALEDSL